jgi:hypothetical protein
MNPRFLHKNTKVCDLVPGKVTRREWLRFMSKVRVSDTGHWLWQAGISSNGYANFWWRGYTYAAHKFAFIALGGVIPKDYQIDHVCRNRQCVFPLHLEAVTAQVNTLRGETPAAFNSKKTHCPRGHTLSGENLALSWIKQGRRICLICKRASWQRWFNKKNKDMLP